MANYPLKDSNRKEILAKDLPMLIPSDVSLSFGELIRFIKSGSANELSLGYGTSYGFCSSNTPDDLFLVNDSRSQQKILLLTFKPVMPFRKMWYSNCLKYSGIDFRIRQPKLEDFKNLQLPENTLIFLGLREHFSRIGSHKIIPITECSYSAYCFGEDEEKEKRLMVEMNEISLWSEECRSKIDTGCGCV